MIRGSTQLVAIIGSPIAQVKSPENFNAWFAENGQDLAMIAVDMAEQNLAGFIQALRGWNNLRGCVVTVPYKQVLASQLDGLSKRAAALGSVNVIRREADGRLLGDNVDGEGFLKAARAHGFQPAERRALVIGSGGVGAAIAYSLCEGGVRQLVIADLDQPRAQALAERLQAAFPQLEIGNRYASLEAFDLVVNATPVGMGGTGETPLPGVLLETLSPAALVADVVTSPVLTPFLELARNLGCRIQTGPEMARAQMGNLGAHMGVMPLDA
ncbi:shikimate dehydrogenase [Metapseudomonas resinovorans]|uniref:shikimate dehydrogenase (NADP(+)) n=1 Tax=Metapseudomonas resinovorans NBRC 106553 TaxID=1245471 RepID=S6AR63_METRE|nr:shikimate dehydrogenase [Pseudomonas resinovorans]BAN48353.1 putative shikimate dehydrogenase [Pseudomonas resinovorans NBRC 106553]